MVKLPVILFLFQDSQREYKHDKSNILLMFLNYSVQYALNSWSLLPWCSAAICTAINAWNQALLIANVVASADRSNKPFLVCLVIWLKLSSISTTFDNLELFCLLRLTSSNTSAEPQTHKNGLSAVVLVISELELFWIFKTNTILGEEELSLKPLWVTIRKICCRSRSVSKEMNSLKKLKQTAVDLLLLHFSQEANIFKSLLPSFLNTIQWKMSYYYSNIREIEMTMMSSETLLPKTKWKIWK